MMENNFDRVTLYGLRKTSDPQRGAIFEQLW